MRMHIVFTFPVGAGFTWIPDADFAILLFLVGTGLTRCYSHVIYLPFKLEHVQPDGTCLHVHEMYLHFSWKCLTR